MYILRYIFKKMMLLAYNKRNHTFIYSVDASTKAKYGYGVRVGARSVIAHDVSIGAYSYVNHDSSLENCTVGNYVSISSGVHISPWEHPLHSLTTHPVGYTEAFLKQKRKEVVIGNDVLISLNCIVLEGVKIGDGAVIGAGAVVTHDVEPYEIVAGIPAKHIRYRFDKSIRERIASMKWWNLSEKEVREIIYHLPPEIDGISWED